MCVGGYLCSTAIRVLSDLFGK